MFPHRPVPCVALCAILALAGCAKSDDALEAPVVSAVATGSGVRPAVFGQSLASAKATLGDPVPASTSAAIAAAAAPSTRLPPVIEAH